MEKIKLKTISKHLAFTIAELLIVMGILGIVAEYVLPGVVKDVTRKAMEQSKDITIKKIRESTNVMRANDLIDSYSTNDDFVNQFQKYIKVTKRCTPANLSECFASKFRTGSKELVNLSILTKGSDLGQEANTSSLVGLQLITGSNMILAFKPDCKRVDPIDNKTDTTSCLALVYDINGFGGPNMIGEDIGLLNATITTCDGKKIGGLCIGASDTTYTFEGTYKDKYNSTKDNYWLGAKNACESIGMRLPNQAEMDTITQNKATIPGLCQGATGCWYWTGTTYDSYDAYYQNIYNGYKGHYPFYNEGNVRCVK